MGVSGFQCQPGEEGTPFQEEETLHWTDSASHGFPSVFAHTHSTLAVGNSVEGKHGKIKEQVKSQPLSM